MTNSLPPDLATFVQSVVATGDYSSPDEVVAAGLRLLQERRAQDLREYDEYVRQAIQVGLDQLDRGEYVGFESTEELQAYTKEKLRRCSEQLEVKKNSA